MNRLQLLQIFLGLLLIMFVVLAVVWYTDYQKTKEENKKIGYISFSIVSVIILILMSIIFAVSIPIVVKRKKKSRSTAFFKKPSKIKDWYKKFRSDMDQRKQDREAIRMMNPLK